MTPLELSELQSKVILKAVASLTMVILTTLDVSFMFLENINSTGREL